MNKQARFVAVVVFCLLCAVGLVVWHRTPNPSSREPRVEALLNKSSVSNAMTEQSSPMHIRGCAAYIQPFPGEKLEPRVLPGTLIDEFRQTYGQESKHVNDIREWEWQAEDFNMQVWEGSDQKRARSIGIDSKPGHVIATPDGIELGKDTFASLLQKMKDRGVSVSERIASGDGPWVLTVSFPSVCDPSLRSEYVWMIAGSPEVEESFGSSEPLHSNIFLPMTVNSYSLEVNREGVELTEGEPASHE